MKNGLPPELRRIIKGYIQDLLKHDAIVEARQRMRHKRITRIFSRVTQSPMNRWWFMSGVEQKVFVLQQFSRGVLYRARWPTFLFFS